MATSSLTRFSTTLTDVIPLRRASSSQSGKRGRRGYLAVTAPRLHPGSHQSTLVRRSTGRVLRRTRPASVALREMRCTLMQHNGLARHGNFVLAKVGVGGSNPLARSNIIKHLGQN